MASRRFKWTTVVVVAAAATVLLLRTPTEEGARLLEVGRKSDSRSPNRTAKNGERGRERGCKKRRHTATPYHNEKVSSRRVCWAVCAAPNTCGCREDYRLRQ